MRAPGDETAAWAPSAPAAGHEGRGRRYVITGGMGFGKTTLIAALGRQLDCETRPEIAALMIQDELDRGTGRLPWTSRDEFEPALLRRRIAHFDDCPNAGTVFFDRGIPDGIAFFRSDGREAPDPFFEAARTYRYDEPVLIVPAWREIYENTPVRPQSVDESVALGELVGAVYDELGYETVEVHVGRLEERVEFVRRLCRLQRLGAT